MVFVRAYSPVSKEVVYIDENGKKTVYKGGTRAWRTNNPGNIINSRFAERQGSIGDDGINAIFPSEELGREALIALLRTRKYQSLTVARAIERYAPDDAEANKEFIHDETGISLDRQMNSLGQEEFRALRQAIETMQGWQPGSISEPTQNGDDDLRNTIQPYQVERVCDQARIDPERLSLKDVDPSECEFSQDLVKINDVGLPDYDESITPSAVSGSSDVVAFAVRIGRGDGGRPPEPNGGPEPPIPITPPPTRPQPAPSPVPRPSPPDPSEPPQDPPSSSDPIRASWDLFISLKYCRSWTPSGYGLGELLYTMSLLPNEETTLEVKSWETSKVQQDTEEEIEEKNVSDIQTTSSAMKQATSGADTKTNAYVDAEAGYSGWGFSASVKAGLSKEVNTSQKKHAEQKAERTQRSVNEYKTARKLKIALSREEGSASKTTRKIKNINQAHTLNVNFYEVLQEYEVSIDLYEKTFALLGARPILDKRTEYLIWWQEEPEYMTLGHLLRFSKSSSWIQAFIDYYGSSPIKVLFDLWSAALWSTPMIPVALQETSDFSLDDEYRTNFRNAILQYIRPLQGWLAPDETGNLRWAYEVIPGLEKPFMNYLSQYISPAEELAWGDYEADLQEGEISDHLQEAIKDKFGPFLGKPTLQKIDGEPRWLLNTVLEADGSTQQLTALEKRGISIIVFHGLADEFEKIELGRQSEWRSTIPTQGIHADLALGVCSGVEDYFAIQRQFDLELKKLEIEKLKLELEMLRSGKSPNSVTVESQSDSTAVNLDIGIGQTPARVQINRGGEENV